MIQRPLWLQLNSNRWQHAGKTGLACLLGLLITHLTGLPNSQWVIITIIVVMSGQLNVGGLLQKSFMRFCGTLAGGGVAMLALCMPHHTLLWLETASIFAIIGFAYVSGSNAAISYVGTLGAATVVIVLLGNNTTFAYGIDRIIEILIGITIALSVSLSVRPIHARHLIPQQITLILLQLIEFHQQACTFNALSPSDSTHFLDVEETLRQHLLALRRLTTEASREPGKQRFSAIRLREIEQDIRQLMRGMLHLHYALAHIPDLATQPLTLEALSAWQAAIQQQLETIAHKLSRSKDAPHELSPPISGGPLPTIPQPYAQQLASDTQQAWYTLLSAVSQIEYHLQHLTDLLSSC